MTTLQYFPLPYTQVTLLRINHPVLQYFRLLPVMLILVSMLKLCIPYLRSFGISQSVLASAQMLIYAHLCSPLIKISVSLLLSSMLSTVKLFLVRYLTGRLFLSMFLLSRQQTLVMKLNSLERLVFM